MHRALRHVPDDSDSSFTKPIPDRSGQYGDAAGVWLPSRERTKETVPPWGFDLEACLDDMRRHGLVEYFVDETAMGELWNEAMARPVAAVDMRGVLHYLDRSG